MINKYLKLVFAGLLTLILLSSLTFSSIGNASTKSELDSQLETTGVIGWGEIATPTSFPELIQYAISAFLGLLGIIFVVLIVYAGYNWMTAAGDEEKVSLAKQTLSRAVIGLIIIIAAYSITYFVFSNLPGGGGNAANSL